MRRRRLLDHPVRRQTAASTPPQDRPFPALRREPLLTKGGAWRRGKGAWRLLQKYDYLLPEHFIAQAPASPRDAAKLLVYNRTAGEICVDTFRHLAQYLPEQAVLVFNETKVIPARLKAKKNTGGTVELLVLQWQGRNITALANRQLAIRQQVHIDRWILTVVGQKEAEFRLHMNFSPRNFPALLDRYGLAPVPPYIKHASLSRAALKREYQTVFAKHPGSAAAPTASLHFTKRLMTALHRQGHNTAFVTLHVGLGTFAPLKAKQLRTGRLHEEHYEISSAAAARLNRWKAEGRPIIAVGTTVARTLESAARRGRLIPGKKATDIFIRPGYQWKFVDGLITNFHVPRSSLMMLVASLIGREQLFALYAYAQRHRFRFFSFGDGMLLK